MTSTTKSLVAAAAVLTSTGAILIGATMRDRIDVGGVTSASIAGPLDSASTSGLVASRDKSEVPEGDYFYEITNLLKQRYVEAIVDERKLATGAIRGMVASLGDPDSLFLDKEQFDVHRKMRFGQFEGVGVQLEVIYTQPRDEGARSSGQPPDPQEALLGSLRIPKLTVVSVVPGGPADKAGVRVGDYVEYVDDHWIPNAETVLSFRKLQRDFNDGKVKWEQISPVRLELTQRMKKMLLPLKAREKLMVGKQGAVKVVWKRGKASLPTTITRGESRFPAFADADGVLQLRFVDGVEAELKEALAGKDSLVIDLRNNANGLPGPMRSCLELLAPKGTYGTMKMGKRELPMEVKTGNATPPRITLLVDKSTWGVAEVFADVLVQAKVAKISGSETANHRILVEDFPLPDGSGYTLAVAEYKAGAK
jgi:carboxyl-terminal processing protease